MTDPVFEQTTQRHTLRFLPHWTKNHPAFKDDEPTLGEKAADQMRHAMGSWNFVFWFIGIMVAWAVWNSLVSKALLGHKGFDPYPYILLNLMLSTLAGLQGAILLIAAKRADQIAGKLAMHTDLMSTQAAERDERIEQMLTRLLNEKP